MIAVIVIVIVCFKIENTFHVTLAVRSMPPAKRELDESHTLLCNHAERIHTNLSLCCIDQSSYI